MNPIQTIREALERAHDESLDEKHIECRDTLRTQIAALAELEKQERDGPNWNPRPGWQQLADGTSCYTTTATTVQVAGEPVAWQRRMRPTWGSHSACPWSPWEPCTKGQAEDHWKTPLLHDWAYEARALCLAAPVAQQPQAKALTDEQRLGWYAWRVKDLEEKLANAQKQPQAEAVPPDVTDNWQQYAKGGETAQQCIERHRGEHDSLLTLLSASRAELGRAYRCIQAMHNALTAMQADIPGNGYHSPTIAAAKRFVWEGAIDGTDYFVGKPVAVLHAALALPKTLDAALAAAPKEQP